MSQWSASGMDELLAQSLAMEDYSAFIGNQSTTSSGFPSSANTTNSHHKEANNHNVQTIGSNSTSTSNHNPPPNPNAPPKVPNPPSLPLVLRRYVSDRSVIDLSNDVTAVNPDVFMLFQKYNVLFFDGKLSGCELKWSKRMTLCAGLCCYEGQCTVH